MRNYSYLKTIPLSFFSEKLYRDVGRNWDGVGFKYLLLLSTIVGLGFLIFFVGLLMAADPKGFSQNITHYMFEESELTVEENLNRIANIISQVPLMELNDNKISTDVDQPYEIIDPYDQTAIAIIDTTGQVNSLAGTEAYILVTKHKFFSYNEETGREEISYFSDLKKERDFNEQDFNVLLDLLSQFPEIKINDGVLTLDEDQPYFINYPENNYPILVVDTTGQYNDLNDIDTAILFTSDTLFVKNLFEEGFTEIFLADLDEPLIAELLTKLLEKLRTLVLWVSPFIVFPTFILATFVSMVIVVIFYSILAVIFASLLRVRGLEYPDLMRLCCVALTPVLIIRSVMPIFIPSQGLVYFLISVGFVFFAVKSNANYEKTQGS